MNKAVAWWERQCDNCRNWLWGREDIPAEGMRGARRWTATVVLAWGAFLARLVPERGAGENGGGGDSGWPGQSRQ